MGHLLPWIISTLSWFGYVMGQGRWLEGLIFEKERRKNSYNHCATDYNPLINSLLEIKILVLNGLSPWYILKLQYPLLWFKYFEFNKRNASKCIYFIFHKVCWVAKQSQYSKMHFIQLILWDIQTEWGWYTSNKDVTQSPCMLIEFLLFRLLTILSWY